MPVVLVTTGVWADVVSEVACDIDVQVSKLTPAGVDPHEFEPSLAQRVEMERAALIVENGLRLEVGLLPALGSLDASIPVFTVSDYVALLPPATQTSGQFDPKNGA
ncbi:MAG: metal ABC transporter substrate-binding protein, partial [Acidimicrobiales bacterium]